MSRDPKFASIGLVQIGEELARARKEGEPGGQGLVGRFLHTFYQEGEHEGQIQQQGHVVEEVQPGVYLVQWYEWIMGEPNGQTLVALADMLTWTFYDDDESWRFAYENRPGGRRVA